MRISVIGTGYVGLVTAACLAEIGHTVVGMDDDRAKVDCLTGGQALPIYEPHLDSLVRRNTAAGRFLPNLDPVYTMRFGGRYKLDWISFRASAFSEDKRRIRITATPWLSFWVLECSSKFSQPSPQY